MLFKPVPLEDCDIQFFGMKRSGNHAVLDWILAHYTGWIHYNNAIFRENGIVETTQIQSHNSCNNSIVSFEDIVEDRFLAIKVLLLRDPFNMFASRFKQVRDFIKNGQFTCLDLLSCNAIDLWKNYAKLYLEGDYIEVNFNFWFKDQKYRENLSLRLGFNQFNDCGFGSKKGWKYSGGSSFKSPNVLNSWKNFSEDEEFLSFFDEEMVELSNQIFQFKINVKPNLEYRNSIERIIQSALSYCDKKEFEKANEILFQAQKIFTKNTRIEQLIAFLNRDIHLNYETTVQKL
jgi:hypothetical protein